MTTNRVGMDYAGKSVMCKGREAVRQTGVPQYLGAPDDLKLLLMKAQNRKVRNRGYHVHDRSRLSFQGNWYICPGLLNRLADREFEIYYDRRDISVIYLFVDGTYVGEAYCPAFMGQRISEWEAKASRSADREKAQAAATAAAEVRVRLQAEIEAAKKQRRRVCSLIRLLTRVSANVNQTFC